MKNKLTPIIIIVLVIGAATWWIRRPDADSEIEASGASELSQALESCPSPPSLGMVCLHAEDWGDYTLYEDEQFHRLTVALVELFCAESLSAISNQCSVSLEKIALAVYLGSRVVKPKEDDRSDYTYQTNVKIREYPSRDRTLQRHDRMLQSMSGRDAFPVVRDALARHQLFSSVSVERALAVSLPYSGERRWEVDRILDTENNRAFEYKSKRDRCLSKEPNKNAKLFGSVENMKESYALVKVCGLDERVLCHSSQSRSLHTLSEGDPISLTNFCGDDGRPKGKDVKKCSPHDLDDWEDTQKYSLSPVFRRKNVYVSKCRPDFRALHYVADQMLREFNRDGTAFAHSIPEKGVSGQFEETLDEPLKSAIKASRNAQRSLNMVYSNMFITKTEEMLFQTYLPIAMGLPGIAAWHLANDVADNEEHEEHEECVESRNEKLLEDIEKILISNSELPLPKGRGFC